MGFASQDVSTTDTTFGTHEASALQSEENLFEIWLRKTGAFRDIAHRRRSILRMDRQRKQSSARIITTGGNLHVYIVGDA